MRCVAPLLALLVMAGCCSVNPHHNNADTLGWDLTYKSLIKTNNIQETDWIYKWLTDREIFGFRGKYFVSPIRPLILNWRAAPIVSSILLEIPSFHDGQHVSLWLVRTESNLYYYQLSQEKELEKGIINDTDQYEEVLREISAWHQLEKGRIKGDKDFNIKGYIGILNTYDRGVSKQLLMAPDDLMGTNGAPGRCKTLFEIHFSDKRMKNGD